jgi:membrane-bound lytic murein transglycosylase A
MRAPAWAGLLAAGVLAAWGTGTGAQERADRPANTAEVAANVADVSIGDLIDRVTASDRPTVPNAFAALAGWAEDDHVAALHAVTASCSGARDPGLLDVCRRAQAEGPFDEASARAFLERNFRPEPLVSEGLLTAYFMPIYEARATRQGEFTAPVRPRPWDLPRMVGTWTPHYADRTEIESRSAPDALAWMRPEDLFFLQIQGSGVLIMPDAPPMRAVCDGTNGAPFVGIANVMRQEGLLPDADTSADTIHGWLAANRGPSADAIMQRDPRYVFFRLQPDDGSEPAGSAGVPLIPGRALAVDPSQHAMGEVLWVDASAPGLSGAFPSYRRLAMALDTGGAIKGRVRADLYLGRGPIAGQEAGRVRHVLRLYRLTPLAQPLS